MNSLRDTMWPMFSSFRRYTWALTGDRGTGDWYARIALETLAQEPFRVRAGGDVKLQLYKLLGEALSVNSVASDIPDDAESDDMLKQGLLALPLLKRHLFLLVTREGFAVGRAAELFGMAESEAQSLVASTRQQMHRVKTSAYKIGSA